ncbi:hypothetical protein ACLB2K_000211 [Fragaria x ananassa]
MIMSDMDSHLSNSKAGAGSSEELPASRYCPVGQSLYDLGRKQPLGNGLESWHGFHRSIRPTQIDMSSTSFSESLSSIRFFIRPLYHNIQATRLSQSDQIMSIRGVS